MQNNYSFSKALNHENVNMLKDMWLASLPRPQDGMWESFRNDAIHFEIRDSSNVIGYACIGDNNVSLQFYIIPEYRKQGVELFRQFIQELDIKNGIVGTNNPVYLSLALHTGRKPDIHTYLFEPGFETTVNDKKGDFKMCTPEDIERIVVHGHKSVGASKEWLTGYFGDLIEKGEVFVLEKKGEIIGTCEVRKSATAPAYADIGMIVAPEFRKQGYGTLLLNKAKTIAIEWSKIPICSCEKDNTGSLKSIQNCGFVSNYQLLAIDFNY